MDEQTAARTRHRGAGLARRCVMAGVVGAGLGLVWLAVTGRASLAAEISSLELGGLAIVVVVLPAGALVAWPLLWAARVRRAWRVALLAPVPVLALWHLLDAAMLDSGPLSGPGASRASLVALMAGGYATAAMATAPGVRPWTRAGIVALLVVPVSLSVVLPSSWATSRLADELRAYGHPLLAPDLPGWRVEGVTTTGFFVGDSRPMVRYWLWSPPTGAPTTGRQGSSAGIAVTQMSVPEGFDPPANCQIDLGGGPVRAQPCVRVAPEVWKISQSVMPVYVVRHGDQVEILSSPGMGPDTDPRDGDLLEAAMSMRERAPSHFTGNQR